MDGRYIFKIFGGGICKECVPNYKTARERLAVIEEKVKEDLAGGRMVKTTYKEAKKKFGDHLLIGALGLVEEGQDKFRLDGTHKVLINNRIRARDQLRSPMVNELQRCQRSKSRRKPI